MTNRAKVWTYGYFPFTMGGKCWRPMIAEVEVTGPHDLGKGFQGYLCIGPGIAAVAEVESGGIVARDLGEARADVALGDPQSMREQVEQAKREVVSGGTEVTEEEFWRRYRNATDKVKP